MSDAQFHSLELLLFYLLVLPLGCCCCCCCYLLRRLVRRGLRRRREARERAAAAEDEEDEEEDPDEEEGNHDVNQAPGNIGHAEARAARRKRASSRPPRGTSARHVRLVDEDAGERASTTRKGFARRLRGDASESRPARARARYAAAGAGADESEDTVDAEPPALPPAPETRKEWKGIVADMD